jgi:hypothetical protein
MCKKKFCHLYIHQMKKERKKMNQNHTHFSREKKKKSKREKQDVNLSQKMSHDDPKPFTSKVGK